MTNQYSNKRCLVLTFRALLSVALFAAVSGSGALVQAQESIYFSNNIQLLQEKAEQGDAKAQHRLGTIYLVGRIVPKDHEKSLEWNFRAAEQGNSDAIRSLKAQYFFGNIPDENAAKWHYLFASVLGLSKAQTEVGDMYRKGEDVPQNYAEALKWYYLSAEQGEYSAQKSLGFMYFQGNGVPRNYKEAYVWFSLALVNAHKQLDPYIKEYKNSGNVEGLEISQKLIYYIKQMRNMVAQTLSPSDLAIAQKEAESRHDKFSKSK